MKRNPKSEIKKPKSRARPRPSTSGPQPSTVLLAVVGISPAILTETVWSLAQGDERHPPVIPDEVVAVTTIQGREKIEQQLLTASPDFEGQTVWQSLRRRLLGPDVETDSRLTLRIEVIARPDPKSGLLNPLADIVSPEDNLTAAEFIFQQVRKHSFANDSRLIASLAGGRKTMSSLLHAAFSHLARPQDRLTHILVNEPFDGGLRTPFFYPDQPQQELTDRQGKEWRARDARLILADVPFAPMRLRFPDIAEIPTRFRALVETYSDTWKRDATKPALIELMSNPPRVIVDGKTVELEGERQLTVIEFLLLANQKEWLEKNQDEALEIFKAWHGHLQQLETVRKALRPTIEQLHKERSKKPGPEWIKGAVKEDIKRPLSFWRKALERAGSTWLPPQRDLRFPRFKLAKTS